MLFVLAILVASSAAQARAYHKSRSLAHRGRAQPRSPASSVRQVFAHVVQGNFQAYTAFSWAADVALAASSGIDGFVLNVGHDPSDSAQLALAYSAAEAYTEAHPYHPFYMCVSLDMVYTSRFGSADAILQQYVVPFAGRPGQYKRNGQVFLTTFSGENAATWLEGNADINSAWAGLKLLALSKYSVSIFFAPMWTGLSASTAVSSHPVVDGIGQWLGWPITNSQPSTLVDRTFQDDAVRNNKLYLAPISPFFSVHMTSENNYIYRSDDWLIVNRYLQLIRLETVPSLVELISWNDYGEGHYIGPLRSEANLPTETMSAGAYTSDMPHNVSLSSSLLHGYDWSSPLLAPYPQALLTLILFLNTYYKTLAFPTVSNTSIWLWHRPHPRDAVATADLLSRPLNAAWTSDNVYAVVLVRQGSEATWARFESGSRTSPGFSVKSGQINLLSFAFEPGKQVIVSSFCFSSAKFATLMADRARGCRDGSRHC